MRTERWVAVVLIGLLALPAAAEEKQPEKNLAECIAIALEHHPSLKAAAASVQAGNQRVWQAVSGYLPQISATYSANRRNTSAAARTGTNIGTQSQTFNFYNTGVSFSQMLFDFGQTLDSIRSAQASEQSLQADERTQRETVVLNVKQSYFNLLAARRLLAVADETVRQNQQHLDLAQGRFHVGLAAKFDVTQAQVQLANAELNQVTARNNVAIARETLRNALGLTSPLDFDIVDTLDVHQVHISEQAALSSAYDKRPELQSIRAQELANDEQIAALQKNYLPNITGNGAYDWTGTDYPLQSNWNVGANVNLSIFNGGLTNAQIGEAKANLSNLKFNEEVLRQNIALEVRQAVLNLQQAAESIRVSEKGLQQARENLELAEGRYKTGVGNIIELTDAQASLTTAEANHVQALYNYQTAVAAVEKATAESLRSTSTGPPAPLSMKEH
jgi:outer membrane protein